VHLSSVNSVRMAGLGDFRARATLGVALTALLLLLPFAVLSIAQQRYVMASGTAGIVFILAANAWSVTQGRCHQNITLYGLVPAGMIFMIHVFLFDGLIAAFWCYPSILACYCMLSERKAWMANAAIMLLALPMVWLTIDVQYASRLTATMFAISGFAAILVRVIDEQQRQLEHQVVRDSLTGLLNRQPLRQSLERAIDEYQTSATDMSLLALDLDHFKLINDSFGHDEGDNVLRRTGELITSHIRRGDLAFRVGGEEFFVLLHGANAKAAASVAESLRQSVESHPLANDQPVTTSIGVATLTSTDNWKTWTKRADELLYQAKSNGRNCVSVEPDELTHAGSLDNASNAEKPSVADVV